MGIIRHSSFRFLKVLGVVLLCGVGSGVPAHGQQADPLDDTICKGMVINALRSGHCSRELPAELRQGLENMVNSHAEAAGCAANAGANGGAASSQGSAAGGGAPSPSPGAHDAGQGGEDPGTQRPSYENVF